MNARLALCLVMVLSAGACGAHAPLRAELRPIALQPEPQPAPLTENHFKRDIMGDVSEVQLREILAAPVYLEEDARIGILPVASGYATDTDLPVETIPGELEKALADSGQFEVVSEVTTDWPHMGSIGGLRELAARYRAEYLLLYRSRFVSRSHANGWSVMWLTLVGGMVFPHRTIEVAGVVEATLLDVKTGTLLFTAYERAYHVSEENVWQNDRKRTGIKVDLMKKATKGIRAKVLEQVTRLVAARPAVEKQRPASAGPL